MRGRRDLFPPDRRLQACMAAVIVLDGLLTVAWVALATAIVVGLHDGWLLVLFLVAMSLGGATHVNRKRDNLFADIMPRDERERVAAIVQRLCLVADMPAPRAIVVLGDVPQCWTTALPFRRPLISVSEGLLRLLDDRELEAVLAHELSHVAQGDAVVMTIAAAPGVSVLRGLRAIWQTTHEGWPVKARIMLPFLVAAGVLVAPWAIVGSVLSRFRELTADEGAARLTGSPAAVSAALVALS